MSCLSLFIPVAISTLATADDAASTLITSVGPNPEPYPKTVISVGAEIEVTVIADGLFRVLKRAHGSSHQSTSYSTYQIVNRRNNSASEQEASSLFNVSTVAEGTLVSTAQSQVLIPKGDDKGNGEVKFTCTASGVKESNWSYHGPSSEDKDPIMKLTPVNAHGFFAFNDAPTPRLVQKASRGPPFLDIMWWDYPLDNTDYDLYFMCYGAQSPQWYALGMQQFTMLTGKAALMPMAQYGLQYNPCCVMSRGSLEATNLPYFLAQLKENDLPLDLYVADYNWHAGPDVHWGGYSWNPVNWPNWRSMLTGLKNGTNPYGAPVPLMANIHPGATMGRPYELYNISQNNTEVGAWHRFSKMMGGNSSSLQNADGSYLTNYYDQQYTEALWVAILDTVMDYAWIDCAYQCKPQYGTASGDLAAEAAQKTLPPATLDFNTHALHAFGSMLMKQNKRPLALLRPPGSNGINIVVSTANNAGRLRGNLGAHRTPMSWSGDTDLIPNHELLHSQIKYFPEACALYLYCGLSSDLGPMDNRWGGLYKPSQTNRYIRLLQWAAFTASFRMHNGVIAPPWVNYTREEIRLLRDPMRLRGALVPYTYTLAERSTRESWPFMRPMWWDFEADTQSAGVDAWNMPGQYMFGDLVIIPVPDFVQGSGDATPIFNASVDVWLPPGSWKEWMGAGPSLTGPRSFSRIAQIGDVPVYVPLGTVLPMWPPGRRVASVTPAERSVLWVLWPGASVTSGSGEMYQDDGVSLDYMKGTDPLQAFYEFQYTFEGGVINAIISHKSSKQDDENNHGNQQQHAMKKKMFGVQLRGVHHATDFQCCDANGSACTMLEKGTVGDYSHAGWWVMDPEHSEFAAPNGSITVLCPAGNVHVSITGVSESG